MSTNRNFKFTNKKLMSVIKLKRKKDAKRPLPTTKKELEKRWAEVKTNKSVHDLDDLDESDVDESDWGSDDDDDDLDDHGDDGVDESKSGGMVFGYLDEEEEDERDSSVEEEKDSDDDSSS